MEHSRKYFRKKLVVSQKSTTFAREFVKDSPLIQSLDDGVMVTLQVLVLSFPVRIRVVQHQRSLCYTIVAGAF